MKLIDMKQYIGDVQGLLAGEVIDWHSEGKVHPVRFLNPDLGLINIEDDIPLYISAFGEKSRQLTADLNAGWLYFGGSPDDAARALSAMQSQWQASNPVHQPDSVLFTLGCVLKPDESPMSARSRSCSSSATMSSFASSRSFSSFVLGSAATKYR